MLAKKNILGVGITDATQVEILEYILKSLKNSQKKYYIVTPNPEFLVLANKNSNFKNILNQSELALADGIGVVLAAKILNKPLKERIAGVDLLESLCRQVVEKPITVGFLGGGDGVADRTAECLLSRYPRLKISFVGQEWGNGGFVFQDERRKMQNMTHKDAESSVVQRPLQRSSAIDILFVAFGAPKQEIWIKENLERLPVKIAIGVGGAFDYIAGIVPRAPAWIRNLGFEWLYRLIHQPWRLKRQLALIEFVFLVLREKIGSRQ